ncbi:MAG: caspase domain-containing protein [Desulfovibrionaceae bacterium]
MTMRDTIFLVSLVLLLALPAGCGRRAIVLPSVPPAHPVAAVADMEVHASSFQAVDSGIAVRRGQFVTVVGDGTLYLCEKAEMDYCPASMSKGRVLRARIGSTPWFWPVEGGRHAGTFRAEADGTLVFGWSKENDPNRPVNDKLTNNSGKLVVRVVAWGTRNVDAARRVLAASGGGEDARGYRDEALASLAAMPSMMEAEALDAQLPGGAAKPAVSAPAPSPAPSPAPTPPSMAQAPQASPAAAEPPAPTPLAEVPAPAASVLGAYHALVVGVDGYASFPPLRTAASDARAVADLLRTAYGFTTRLLLDATRAQIVEALGHYRKTLTPHDNLLIYYAGHGWLDREADEGYWLPADATPDSEVNWVSNNYVTAVLRAMEAKHVLVVADSCYSGTLTRGVAVTMRSPGYLERLAGKRARVVMASGGLEPVGDAGVLNKKHSVFAAAFLQALHENTGVIDGTSLFSALRRPVMVNADQTPEYGDIRKAGHDGGDFVFVRQAP